MDLGNGLSLLNTQYCSGYDFVRTFNSNLANALTTNDFETGGGLARVGRNIRVVISQTNVNTTGKLALDTVVADSPLGDLLNSIQQQLQTLDGWNGKQVKADIQSIQGYKNSAVLLSSKASALITKMNRLESFLNASLTRFESHTHDAADFIDGVFAPDRLGEDASSDRFLAGNQKFV